MILEFRIKIDGKIVGYEFLKNNIWYWKQPLNNNLQIIGTCPFIGKREQYINQTDKNGKKYYIGDLVEVPAGYGGDHYYASYNGYVYLNEDSSFDIDQFGVTDILKQKYLQDWNWNKCEIL